METTVNDRIKMLRIHLNISQSEFAKRTDLSGMSISRIETNETTPRKASVNKIASVFGVSRDWLVNGNGEMRFEDQTEPQSGEVKLNWSATAYELATNQISHLEKEVQFLRDMLQTLTGKMKEANFLEAFPGAGNLKIVGESVRVAA